MEERRHFTRVQFMGPALLWQGEHQCSTKVLDLSLHGILLARPEGLTVTPGETLTIHIPLGEQASIEMSAEVMRVNRLSLGLVWHNIEVESLIHLRRLVELHSPTSIDKELEELWQEL
ncbi:PilZ domain-containing protein [Ferrimonas sp. YFM]|uniref:PilZ domain-containing protein n=1 Tax=Ferrimonas sp. YFM TaxID=3028878 RepID=UPI0025744365|nr:PilZ domain-containing protein [Ferrimonas sp. YFM]BDY03877.1 cyclic diguanosine monophosphate-binding protein [Ferrimonas sp. YFM]